MSRPYCSLRQPEFTLKMEERDSSEMLVTIFQSTQYRIPENKILIVKAVKTPNSTQCIHVCKETVALNTKIRVNCKMIGTIYHGWVWRDTRMGSNHEIFTNF
jgi:hypothetical protein